MLRLYGMALLELFGRSGLCGIPDNDDAQKAEK